MDHFDANKQSPLESQGLTRRQLLKALLVAGGAASVSLLPRRWISPRIEVGALPAHAQVSATATFTPTPTSTLTPTVTLTPTQTPQTPYAINSLTFYNPDTNTAFFHAADTVATFATIMPPSANVPLYARIYLQQPGHPDDGVVSEGTRYTDALGRSALYEYDMSVLSPLADSGAQRFMLEWGFLNPSDGWNSLQGFVDILPNE
ncbi:MAG: twin-arginine translocation signal domain-containing protein [Anaerolineae bacterium]|nr:twin-arginine translocation signal domain-containing protein [Anaerolineae bacterium]